MSRYLHHTKTRTATLRRSAWSIAVVVTCFPGWRGGPRQQAVAHPGQSPIAKDDHASQQSARTKRDRLMEIYLGDAAEYTIYRDASRKDRVELGASRSTSGPTRCEHAGRTVRSMCGLVGPPRGPRLLLLVPRHRAARALPRVSFAVALGVDVRHGEACAELDAAGPRDQIVPIPGAPAPPRPRGSGSHRCAR